jgi:DNA-binding MarR family transcriptional regulator
MGSRGIIEDELLSGTAATLVSFDALIQQLDQILDRRLADGTVNNTAVRALRVVESAGRRGMRQCLLAEAMKLPAATVSRLVDALVKKDLISRAPHPTDRRVTMLALTAAGEQRLEQRRADYRGLAEALTPEAVEAMRATAPLLDVVIQTLALTAQDKAA